jgi:hypothetical protein
VDVTAVLRPELFWLDFLVRAETMVAQRINTQTGTRTLLSLEKECKDHLVSERLFTSTVLPAKYEY